MKRCPKGTRRNKKTGECEPIKTKGPGSDSKSRNKQKIVYE